MPKIPLYTQRSWTYSHRADAKTARSPRHSFFPIADFWGEHGPEDDRIIFWGKGGEVPRLIKVPIDAKFDDDFKGPTPWAVIRWKRNPIECKLGPSETIDAHDAHRIARLGLKAENGDTFTFEEETSNASRPIRDPEIGQSSPPLGSLRPELDGAQTQLQHPDREVGQSEGDPPPHPGRIREIPGHPGAGDLGTGLRPDPRPRIPFPELGLIVVGPDGSRLVGGIEAPCLRIGGEEQGTNIALIVLPGLAIRGRYGLAVEPLVIPEAAPIIPSSEVFIPDRTPIYSEALPRRGRRVRAEVGQLSMF